MSGQDGDPPYTYSDSDLDSFLSVAVKLAGEAGSMISAAIGREGGTAPVAAKTGDKYGLFEGTGSSVLTETDAAVERHLVDGFTRAFPDHRFIGEEDISATPSGMVETFTNRPTWIIDPIDGTMNFIHRNPLCCTSIGLTINKSVGLDAF